MVTINNVEYLNTSEVASKVGVSPTTITNWVRSGLISPALTNPKGKRYFTEVQANEWMKSGVK